MDHRDPEANDRDLGDEATRTIAAHRPPELPEKYEILGILGSGGMGMVLRARDKSLDRLVAVKVIGKQQADKPEFVRRFLSEARAAARMNHPEIVQIYEYGEGREGCYLVMEFVDGRSVAEELGSVGRLSEEETLDLGRKACSALSAAHAAGIVHRDIKPDNMMRAHSGEFKLVDLGLAKCLVTDSSQTQTGQPLGTPNYISPEQIMGAKVIDPRSDLYSLGATLYHLATGRIPFEGSSTPHIMSRHLNDPLPDPRQYVPELSDGFCRIVGKLLEKDPSRRYQDASALDEDLDRMQRGGMPAISEPTACTLDTAVFAATESITEDEFASIESALASAIGPLARVLVRKSARSSASRQDLRRDLADQIPGDRERERFLKATSDSLGGASSGSGNSAPDRRKSDPGIADSAPDLDPARLRDVERHLARAIGPVAGILLKRESKASSDLSTLVERLAGNIDDAGDRRAFLAAIAASD